VLYLGEINDSQHASWLRCIEVIEEGSQWQLRLALFPADRAVPAHAAEFGVQVRLSEFRLERPRVWGACWVMYRLWAALQLDQFWQDRLPDSREGTSWHHVLVVLVAYRLIAPGSEWRCHREWYPRSAMGDLLGEDAGLLAKDNPYRCLDQLLAHKAALFTFPTRRWQDLFGVTYDLLLYDLTSTYFESDPPVAGDDPRAFGYSRDHRPDCVQVVLALVVTPEGFPLAYEVLPGNTADNTTLPIFLAQIEARYGQARRIWVMDRGVPAEAHLAQLRARSAQYLVGTPKGRLTKLEQPLLQVPWHAARSSVQVKLLPQEGELYVWVQSATRVAKERAMRRRRLKHLWARLHALQRQRPTSETLLLMLGAAKKEAGRAWALVGVELPAPPPQGERARRVDFTFTLNTAKLRQVRRREGRYLLRSNLTATDPAQLWAYYLQLVENEAAFKSLKGDLAVRPIYHQRPARIEAHIFVAFLAYCLHVTLRAHLRPHAPGLTVRQVLDKFAAMQLLDVHFPTTDGRELIFTRHTAPAPDQQLLLAQLGWTLPPQPPLLSENNLTRSRGELFQPVLMMQPPENRSLRYSHVPWELMTGNCSRQSRWCLRQTRTQLAMRPRLVVMAPPNAKNPPQMRLPERNEEVQTLSAQRAEESLTIRVRQGRLDWRAKDPDTHGRHGRLEPRRLDAVPIVEDEAVPVWLRQDLPELLEGPRGGWVGGSIDEEQAATAHIECDKDIQDAQRRGHHDAEVAGHERLGVIPDERRPLLPTGSGRLSSPATPAAHVAAHRARRHPDAKFEEQFRGNPLLAPGHVLPRHSADQLLEFCREPRPARARPPAPEAPEGLPVPADERRGLHNRQRLAPREAAREQDERKPERVRGASGFHLPLAVEGQLFPQEKILRGQGGPGADGSTDIPHDVDCHRDRDSAHVNQRIYAHGFAHFPP
jgi:hypothetical protein